MTFSARPSVMELNLCCRFFTLVGALRQPQAYFGFPSGSCGAIQKKLYFQRSARIATSTESGKVPKAVNSADTRFFRHLSIYVTRCCEWSAIKADNAFIFARVPLGRLRHAPAIFPLISFGIEARS